MRKLVVGTFLTLDGVMQAHRLAQHFAAIEEPDAGKLRVRVCAGDAG